MSQILLFQIVPVWRSKPYGIKLKRRISVPKFRIVENRITHAGKEIRLLVYGLAKVSVLDQVQEYLVKRVLSAAAIARNHRRKQQQGRPVLPIQMLDFVRIPVCSSHSAVPILRQFSRMDLFMPGEVFTPGKNAYEPNISRAIRSVTGRYPFPSRSSLPVSASASTHYSCRSVSAGCILAARNAGIPTAIRAARNMMPRARTKDTGSNAFIRYNSFSK